MADVYIGSVVTVLGSREPLNKLIVLYSDYWLHKYFMAVRAYYLDLFC